jgi:two-component sensor histidine kinase
MRRIQSRSWHGLILMAIAAIGVGLSAILAVQVAKTQTEATRHRLMVEAATFAEDLEQYLLSREMIALTVGTVFEVPDLSSPHPLGSIGNKVLALLPDVGVMAWIPQVDPARIHEVFAVLTAAGQAPRLYGPNDETVDVTNARRPLYPVIDVAPKAAEPRVGLGMEVGLFPSRKAAFEQARDERRVIATAPVELLQPANTKGYVLYSPVYNARGFAGCLLFTFGVDRLLNGFIHGRRIPMNFRIFDATDPGPPKYLAGVMRQGEIEDLNSSARAYGPDAVRQSVDFAGRKLSALFDLGPGLALVGLQQAFMVLALGLVLTAMVLWSMFYFMRSSQRLASEMAISNAMKASIELTNRELTHRVGNLMAVAQGIIRLSYNASLDTLEFKEAILARLNALHRSVGLINRENWRGVWLHELLDTELAPVAERIDVSGSDALLKPKAAQSLSLMFYELMTNSSKHGALSVPEERVAVKWWIKDAAAGRIFCFQWQERSLGIVKPPTRQGFGTKLLTRLVPGDLLGRATLDYEAGWFRYELEAPAERIVEQETDIKVNFSATIPLAVASAHLGSAVPPKLEVCT